MNQQLDKLINIAEQISRGEIPGYQHNECYTSGAFDLLLVTAQGPEAFALLTELCSRFDSLRARSVEIRGIYVLASLLAVRSKTTEMPVGMEKILLSYPEHARELRQWYRFDS